MFGTHAHEGTFIGGLIFLTSLIVIMSTDGCTPSLYIVGPNNFWRIGGGQQSHEFFIPHQIRGLSTSPYSTASAQGSVDDQLLGGFSHQGLGTIKVEKYVKWAVKKLGSRNRLGSTNEAHFPTLIS